MNFNSYDDAEAYARKKYNSTASNIFGYFCHPRKWEIFWQAAAHATGTSSDSPGFALGVELPYLYNNFKTPVEAYSYASFYLDFDTNFEIEERMPLPDFIEYLKDANTIARQMHPEHETELERYLEKAIEKITALQKAHEEWKRRNGDVLT